MAAMITIKKEKPAARRFPRALSGDPTMAVNPAKMVL
jgi:hypothetical protein